MGAGTFRAGLAYSQVGSKKKIGTSRILRPTLGLGNDAHYHLEIAASACTIGHSFRDNATGSAGVDLLSFSPAPTNTLRSRVDRDVRSWINASTCLPAENRQAGCPPID